MAGDDAIDSIDSIDNIDTTKDMDDYTAYILLGGYYLYLCGLRLL